MAKKKAKKTQAKRASGGKKTKAKSQPRRKAARAASPRKKVQRKAKPAAQATSQSPPPPKPGSFVWHELMTPDVARSKDFYSRLFGWKMRDDEMMPGFTYTMMSNKGEGVGGMMAITPEQGDVKPHWMVYIAVKDVDAIAQQTEMMGGEIAVPPHDIPVGRWALLKDPTGAAFAVYKSARR